MDHSPDPAPTGDAAAADGGPIRAPALSPVAALLAGSARRVDRGGLPRAEAERLAALSRYHIVGAPPDEVLTEIVHVATMVCGTANGAVNLIDADEQWQAAVADGEPAPVPREDSFCAVTIEHDGPMVIRDARTDQRVAHSRYATGEDAAVRSYAGAQLTTADGHHLGALCVFDAEAREFSSRQVAVLERLARLAVGRLEARRDALLLTQTEELFRLAFDEAPVGMAILDLDRRFVRVNPTFAALVGYDIQALVGGMGPTDLTHADDVEPDLDLMRQLVEGDRSSYRMEKRYLHRLGHEVWVELWGGLIRDPDGSPVAYVKQVDDISERKQLERGLVHQATHDALTGLPNRVLLRDRIEQALAAQRRSGCTAVLSLDLDGFKPINDTYGHAAGDRVLVEVAARLRQGLRTHDSVVRLGGDEFVVVAHDTSDRHEHAHELGRRLQALVTRPIALADGTEVGVTVSVGGVLTHVVRDTDEGPYPTPSLLLARSDEALYRAKRRERGSMEIVELDG